MQRWILGLGAVVSIAAGMMVGWPSMFGLQERSNAARPTVPRSGKLNAPKKSGREHDQPIPVDRDEAPEGALNVVLVFGCTVRKDQTSVYSDLPTTPWLSTLAASGAVFEDALSVSSWTRASAVGVLTATHPLALNLPEPGPKQSERVLPDGATTLAERLADEGWMTFGSTANPNLNAIYGMAQGMDRYRDSHPKAFKAGRQSGEDVILEAVAMLDDRDDAEKQRPFYLQVMIVDAHHPRQPQPGDLGKVAVPGAPSPLTRYRATLLQVDRAVQRLDTELRERGYDETNTVFVFVADHGEGLDLPAHHQGGHGKQMYPSTVEIPWIVRAPGVRAGTRVPHLASGVDVSPTILGLLDLDPPSGDGLDLAPWLRGQSKGPVRDRAFAASMFHVADVASVWTSTQQCQQYYANDRDKDVTGCFDRKADPTFTQPIELPELRAELEAWREAKLVEGRAYPVRTASPDAEVVEQLELLGYADE